MKYTVLVAAGAAGPPEVATAVLARFGFERPVTVVSREDALARMRDEHYDLVILPLQEVKPVELLAIEREIRSDGRTSVIATAPSADPELILRAMRAGVQEFLVHPPSAEELARAVERLMRHSRTDAVSGELVAIYSAKGGLGCTSVAVNLAHAYATSRPETRVALTDLVVAGGDVRVFLNLKPAYDLSDLVDKGDKVDAELLTSLMSACPGGVWALPTGENPGLEDVFDAQTISSMVNHLRGHFGVTVVDCEHHLNERTLSVLDGATRILVVTQLDVPSLRSTQRTLAICRRLGYGDDKLSVVVNRYQSNDVLSLKDAEGLLQCPIWWKLPNDYRTSAAALAKGVPVAEEEPASKLARSYTELAKKLAGLSAAQAAARNGAGAGSRLRKLFRLNKGAGNVA